MSAGKSNILKRGCLKLDLENFILYYYSVDWEYLLKIDEMLPIQPKCI